MVLLIAWLVIVLVTGGTHLYSGQWWPLTFANLAFLAFQNYLYSRGTDGFMVMFSFFSACPVTGLHNGLLLSTFFDFPLERSSGIIGRTLREGRK